MEKLFTYALAVAVGLGTTAVLANSRRGQRQDSSVEQQLASDGAFRDGLYVGKLTAESGRPSHPLTGRWSSEKDRASFRAGYPRGYGDFLDSADRNRPE